MDMRRIFEQNPALLLKKERMRSVFNDVYLNDVTKVNLMMAAYSIDIVGELKSHYPMNQFDKARLVKILVQQHSIMDTGANWAVDEWNNMITAAVLRGLDEAEKSEKESEKKRAERLAVEEETKRIEEEQRREREKEKLRTREDYDSFYINPSLDEIPTRIYIPCGVGNTDGGFFIHGIEKALQCKHPDANIYALIYNYLMRNSRISDEDIPQYIRQIRTPYELDFRSIFRMTVIILQMIRHNVIRNTVVCVAVHDQADRENVKYAIGLLNHYGALFSRLIGVRHNPLQLKLDAKGSVISLSERRGIYAVNNDRLISNAREIWYGRKINYRLTKANLPDLEYILSEISPFSGFKEGQFDALSSMLASKKHAVCIMPTGSGKSLIYYLASLLQPLPLFVIAPTEILIDDQIRNLRHFHHMDNVAHLLLTGENSFSNYDIHNSLNYVTPMTLQNRNLHVKFRHINNGTNMRDEAIAPGTLLSYVVLDEIHCLSNWGHDFRPEYLMLSRFLNRFMDQVAFWGFTATADYTVVSDVQKQLNIPQNSFFSPIAFEKYNVSYDFRVMRDMQAMYDEIKLITQDLIARNERTIVFTKTEEIANRVAEVVGYEADVFSEQDPGTYYQFAEEKCKILIASAELGVGVNLPNITNIIHFGLPISKNEYVQEIGRAGRANENVTSYVLYLDADQDQLRERLLHRNADMDKVPAVIMGLDNDYGDIYRKLTNNYPQSQVLYDQLMQLHDFFEKGNSPTYECDYPFDRIQSIKQQLYMLFVTGYINDWYTRMQNDNQDGVVFHVDVKSQDYYGYLQDPKKMLLRMKKKMREYFESLGNDREAISKINRAESEEAIILEYVEWYYRKYLYHHNEQFLDTLDFFETNRNSRSDSITDAIKDYFVLPFQKIRDDEEYYGEMSIRDIIQKVCTGMDRSSLTNIERINSNKYSCKLDTLLFCGRLRYNSRLEKSRLERAWAKMSMEERRVLRTSMPQIYSQCDVGGRLELVKYLCEKNVMSIDLPEFMSNVYATEKKDLIYYGLMAERINGYFVSNRRKNNV